jgi:hypothetical protein
MSGSIMLVAGSAQFRRCARVQGSGPRASRLKDNFRCHGLHEECLSGYLPPTATLPGKLLRHPRNLIIVELILLSILFVAGIHFPPILSSHPKLPQGLP